MTANDMTANDKTANDMTSIDMTVNNITANDMTVKLYLLDISFTSEFCSIRLWSSNGLWVCAIYNFLL